MTPSDLAALQAPSLEHAVHELIDLLQTSTSPGTSELGSLRRILHGRYRAGDEVALAGRFQRARLLAVCVAPPLAAAVRSELLGAVGLLVDDAEPGLVVLVPGLPRDTRQDPVARVVARIHRVAPSAGVGVSTALDRVGDAVRGFDEACRALALSGPGRVVLADDSWFELAVSRLEDGLRDSLLVAGPLDRLDECALDLRTTLSTWLELDGDVRTTAARLHLHPNTLRYRLRRAAEITGLDFADPMQRLVAHLVLRRQVSEER